MTELAYKRVLVDSRYRIAGGSPSDFTYQLLETLDCPPGTTCHVADVLIPVAWYTIEEFVNDVVNWTTGQEHTTTLSPGGYTGETLADELKLKMGQTIQNSSFIASYDKKTNRITMQHPTVAFQFLLGYSRGADGVIGVTDDNAMGNTHLLFPDVRHIHQVLLQSNLGRCETMGPLGSLNCIKRIPVTGVYGEVMNWEGYHPSDKIDVGGQVLSQLTFRLTSIDNQTINLHDTNLSFSLLFE